MVNSTFPFNEKDLKKQLKDQLGRKWEFRNRIKNNLSKDFVDLTGKLLEPNINCRISLAEIRAALQASDSQSKM
jgi:hypothetical protein